jgi:hypothetical protein
MKVRGSILRSRRAHDGNDGPCKRRSCELQKVPPGQPPGDV